MILSQPMKRAKWVDENPRQRLAFIGGSGLLESSLFSHLEVKTFETLRYQESSDLIFISRHSASLDKNYSMPHEIDHVAIWKLLKSLSPSAVVGLCSVGSLHPQQFPVGSLCLPTDWMQANYTPLHFHANAQAHIKPTLNSDLRTRLCQALDLNNNGEEEEIVYVQTRGPRFETRAEVRQLSQFAHVVGMTAGDEATMACELNIPYAIVAMVDNLAHGVIHNNSECLDSLSQFKQAQTANLLKMEQAVHLIITRLLSSTMGKEIPACPVHTLILAQYVATLDENDTVWDQGGVIALDEAGTIVGVHDRTCISIPPYAAQFVFQLPDVLLTPGLVNAHTHAAMCLMRGFGDDLDMNTWLTTKVWPAEIKCVSPEFVRFGTQCAVEEMLASGTTTFLDFYFFPEEIAKVCAEYRMRCVVGLPVLAFPNAMAQNGSDHLRRARNQLESQSTTPYDDLISYGVAPHATYSVDEDDMVLSKQLADSFGTIFHTHMHETQEEVDESLVLNKKSSLCHRCDTPSRPLQNLERLGLLDKSCSFAHCCHLTQEEILLLRDRECSVVHCPASNLKLASGFCPVASLLEHGVNVCLGTDGACSNNSLDMLAEMKLCALLGKGVAKDASKVTAHQVLRMATINGARALGLGHKIGSIEVGKQGDLVAIELKNRNACRPVFDPVATLVYSGTKDCVSHVWVKGFLHMRDGVRVSDSSPHSHAEWRKLSEKYETMMREVEKELYET